MILSALDDELIVQAVPEHRQPTRVTANGEVLDPRLCELPDHAQLVNDGGHQSLRSVTHRYGRLLGLQRRALLRRREEWLTDDGSVLSILQRIPETRTRLLAHVPAGELLSATRVALLTCVDGAWSDHLAHITNVREGIHLRVLVRENPLEEFNRVLAGVWPVIIPAAIDAALHLVSTAEVRDGRLDLTGAGLRRPSATWAYTVTDNSLGSEGERMAKALFKDARVPRYF